MSFVRPITTIPLYGTVCRRVLVGLSVLGARGETAHWFRFDTGCDITTLSEDVATALGLPLGGASVTIRGSTGTSAGRLIDVRFRFPPDDLSGNPEPLLAARWAVVNGRTDLALLSLHDVHEHFALWTDDTHLYFTNR
jgi:hypothetical protein